MPCFNVLAEETVQVLIEDTVELFTPAQKIDQIVASIRDVKCHVIPDKVIFQAILHKQIFFVNEDNTVVHQGVDIPFSGFVDMPGAVPGQGCQIDPTIEFVEATLPEPDLLREIVVVNMVIRLLDISNMQNIHWDTAPRDVRIFRSCQGRAMQQGIRSQF